MPTDTLTNVDIVRDLKYYKLLDNLSGATTRSCEVYIQT